MAGRRRRQTRRRRTRKSALGRKMANPEATWGGIPTHNRPPNHSWDSGQVLPLEGDLQIELTPEEPRRVVGSTTIHVDVGPVDGDSRIRLKTISGEKAYDKGVRYAERWSGRHTKIDRTGTRGKVKWKREGPGLYSALRGHVIVEKFGGGWVVLGLSYLGGERWKTLKAAKGAAESYLRDTSPADKYWASHSKKRNPSPASPQAEASSEDFDLGVWAGLTEKGARLKDLSKDKSVSKQYREGYKLGAQRAKDDPGLVREAMGFFKADRDPDRVGALIVAARGETPGSAGTKVKRNNPGTASRKKSRGKRSTYDLPRRKGKTVEVNGHRVRNLGEGYYVVDGRRVKRSTAQKRVRK